MDGWSIVFAAGLVLILYLAIVNYGMQQGAAAAYQPATPRWSEADIKNTAARITQQPIDFASCVPALQDRRYVIVGGSGLVGGCIVQHLLLRGQSPSSLRVIDLREPDRDTTRHKDVVEVPFVRADIASLDSTIAAFRHPWPREYAHKPLTVFHVAAIIRASDRSRLVLPVSEQINVDGTRHVLEAARLVGANIFIATASTTIDLRPVNFWLPIRRGVPRNVLQICSDNDGTKPLRKHAEYFSNYAFTKARAEDAVLKANSKTMKTGCIRASVVYGSSKDLLLGPFIAEGRIQSWFSDLYISCVNVQNLSLAHLLYENALLAPNSRSDGKSFIISDPGGPVAYGDMHKVLRVLIPNFKVQLYPPVIMLMVAHCIEWYCLARVRWPIVQMLTPELPPLIKQLQPAVFGSCNIHQIASSHGAEQSVERGGIGYRGACTTLEGMCMQVLNRDRSDKSAEKREQGISNKS